MKKSNYIFMLLASMYLLHGCTKESSENEQEHTENISASAWYFNNAMIDADNNGTGDINVPPGTIAPCQTDNVLTFATNGTGMVDEGPTKCNAGDPQTTAFNWNFLNNETVLNISTSILAGIGGEFKIIALTKTEMKLSKSITIPSSPSPVTVIVSFVH